MPSSPRISSLALREMENSASYLVPGPLRTFTLEAAYLVATEPSVWDLSAGAGAAESEDRAEVFM